MKPKPLLSRVKSENLPDDIRAAWDNSMLLRGDGTFFEVFAKHPELYRWYIEEVYGKVFRLGKVKNRYKQLLRLKLSTLHGCKFCNQGNRKDALESGLSQEQIENFEDPNLFEASNNLLEYPKQMLDARTNLSALRKHPRGHPKRDSVLN